MNDHDGTPTGGQTVAEPPTAQHPSPSRRAPTTTGTASKTDTTASLRAAATAGLLIDPVVIGHARTELARRYGLLQPDASVALGILLAEGLARCEEAWRERHQHAVIVASYERPAKTKPTTVQFPVGLVDAVSRLADAQYPGVGKMAGRVASAALLEGVNVSRQVAPVADPGLEALAKYAGAGS